MQINVLEYLEATVARFPEKLGVSDEHGAVSFRELKERALAMAARIIRKSDAHDRPIAVFLPKCSQCVVSFAGILYSGNAYVPLDEKSPPERLRLTLENIRPEVVITDTTHATKIVQAGFPEQRLILVDAPDVEPCGSAPAELVKRPSSLIDADPVYIINTSGSTGVPKGVVISHRGVIDYIDWARECYQIDERTVIGNQSPLHFDNSTLDIYLCFATGATLHLLPEALFSFPVKLLEEMVQRRITFVFWVPSVLVAIANLAILEKCPLPPLERILFAGEVMPTKHLNHWRRHFPDAMFSNLYGPTEITVDCTYYIVKRELDDSEPVPIGFPCRNSQILILNERDEAAGPVEQGELCVRGSSLALGYWNDPDKTSAVFTQNPLNPHFPERIYRTGDIVRRNSLGEIVFLGRKDSQIKHLGYRIELGEIENALMRLPTVSNACVLYNTLEREITAFVEATEAVSPATIRRGLLEALPKYMLPTVLRQLDRLPVNANGKTDRHKLMSMMAGSTPCNQ